MMLQSMKTALHAQRFLCSSYFGS